MAVYCNARKKGNADELEKREPSEEHAGEGYCGQQIENGRCKLHGGESLPPGPNHPTYKHGRHSKHVPDKLREKFEDAIDDEEYMSLMAEIALVDSRIDEVLETIDEDESADDLNEDQWATLTELFSTRRELVSEERKQAEFLAQVVHRDQFVTLMDRMASSIERSLEKHVDDPEAREEVMRDVSREIRDVYER